MSNLGSLDVISGDILDRRDGRILICLKFFFTRTKLIKWQHLRARLASKSRATTANSECRSLLHTFLVSFTVPFFDLLRSSAAKLTHLSLNYLIQFYLTLCLVP